MASFAYQYALKILPRLFFFFFGLIALFSLLLSNIPLYGCTTGWLYSPLAFYGIFPYVCLKTTVKSALNFPLILTIFQFFSLFCFLLPSINFVVLSRTYTEVYIFFLPRIGQHSVVECFRPTQGTAGDLFLDFSPFSPF